MKSSSLILLAVAALSLVACNDNVKVSGTIADAPDSQLVIKQLEIGSQTVLDTLITDKSGRFSFSIPVEEKQPEFVYVFYGDRKVASLLLEKGETVTVTTDTLGHYTTTGSEGSALMEQVDGNYSRFASNILAALSSDNASAAVGKAYVDHYRECIRFIETYPGSLATIPVLYEKLNDYTSIFAQPTDALHFRAACDTLKTLYPQSKYVLALEKETVRRENILNINNKIANAETSGFPNIILPGIDGGKVALNGVDSKVILLHFWTSADASHKMFNQDVLKPLYEKYHSRGLEIYAVSLDPDKVNWASTVKAQNLDWINVVDTKGTNSEVVTLYNLSQIPTSFIIADGGVIASDVKDKAGLERELDKLLK